ncbi:MAG TPA: endonuclease/exonuclease/phosphatase family protein [Dehalococcoidia bacterium]|nr:endonuclease/exonuclease/phosphatase family protein [Dehalococcoidia bacterium]
MHRFAWLYLEGLGVWGLIRLVVGDRGSLLFAVNSLALYMFVPLPLVLGVVAYTRRWDMLAGFVVAAAAWIYLWGALFLPNGSTGDVEGPRLTVMTYNLLGFSRGPESVVETIRESDADVVGLVELNQENAAAIGRELATEYPYQTLTPGEGVRGYGLISRVPFKELRGVLQDDGWVGRPIVIEFDLDGVAVTLVELHAAASPNGWKARERQAHKLADYAREAEAEGTPLIIAGDFNATSTNVSYAIMADALTDSWREAGAGFGNTFPGASKSQTPGSSRPAIFGISAPKWLIRIDYVFHSREWRAVSARNGRFDGHSDHRSLIVELVLKR